MRYNRSGQVLLCNGWIFDWELTQRYEEENGEEENTMNVFTKIQRWESEKKKLGYNFKIQMIHSLTTPNYLLSFPSSFLRLSATSISKLAPLVVVAAAAMAVVVAVVVSVAVAMLADVESISAPSVQLQLPAAAVVMQQKWPSSDEPQSNRGCAVVVVLHSASEVVVDPSKPLWHWQQTRA